MSKAVKFSISDLVAIFETKGHQQYGGEAVSQLEHALQCATLAEAAHQSQEMIVACLLHDLGHLLHGLGEDTGDRGINDDHEHRAMPLLQQFFSAAVTEPIRLHVEAKQYLCAIDSNYWQALSPASQRSLHLQGGVFDQREAAAFINRPFAQQAVQLRQWDDLAKVVGLSTLDLAHFAQLLTACAQK